MVRPRIWIPAWCNTGSVGHPASLAVGIEGFFREVKRPGREAKHQDNLVVG